MSEINKYCVTYHLTAGEASHWSKAIQNLRHTAREQGIKIKFQIEKHAGKTISEDLTFTKDAPQEYIDRVRTILRRACWQHYK